MQICCASKTFESSFTDSGRTKKGFTLAELLIVVAIIAVLVAIAIPIFSAQLEKSREATDLANIRSAYAEVVAAAIVADQAEEVVAKVSLKQQQDAWQTNNGSVQFAGSGMISGAGHVDVEVTGTPHANGTATVTYIPSSDASHPATVSIYVD